jgi:hypothetical protein
MKKRIVIILAIITIVGFVSSCVGTQDCPAYGNVDTNQQGTEQPA